MNETAPAAKSCAAGCSDPALCPLNQVCEGTAVRIKRFAAPPDVIQRLREMGLGEEQLVRLLRRDPQVICQVCNVRLGLSARLAEVIWVEPVAQSRAA